MTRSWFQVRNAASKEAEILIYDEIGAFGITASDFIAELGSITADVIALRINSPGGGVTEGWAIHNAIKRHGATFTAHVDGLCASIATVIALAADRVVAAPGTYWMIHNVSGAIAGGSGDLRRSAQLMEKMEADIRDLYAAKTGADLEQIKQWMEDETWFSAKEALEAGFIDAISDDQSPDARMHSAVHAIAARAYHNAPGDLTSCEPVNMDLSSILGARFNAALSPEDNLAALIAEITQADNTHTQLAADLSILTGERDGIAAQLATAEANLVAANAETATARAEITAVRADLAAAIARADASAASLATAESRVALVEQYAHLRGIDLSNLQPIDPSNSENPSGGPVTLDQIRAEKDPAKRTALFREHRAALKAAARKS